MSILWIGPKLELREDVAQLYEKYKDRIPVGTLSMFSPPDEERKYYVYEWFTKDTGKVFYVGKGTGHRYRHIIYDMKRPRGECYKELQDHFGIDFRFLVKGLTSREAEIYELCMLIERTDQGEVLLQSANNPGFVQWGEEYRRMREACARREFTPEILVDAYDRRYFGVAPPDYDPVDMSRLRVTFQSSFAQITPAPATLQDMDRLREMIAGAGGRVYATVAKASQAIIEFDNIAYRKYIHHKENGRLVYHSFDVERALRGSAEH